ncbi:ADP-ribosylglycohydrolase [Pseudorhodobacter antarcticus]|uniref:ADP-ribosylglycohydrolase n=1 Tax=Pseudorhodobacter antarcticus TaxID=1077947 RepID=A0A1H8LQC3_9RHOB|nr:ADP-ribosylglycohydrolase family protein [Pseudorhodobacter antarcticus]SEO07253.1 ADP-ribosylglycohydrolase [Pseudorhodobacter antarcticus]
MTHPNAAACLMGAFVADAATLGLHWLYDPARIASVATTNGGPAFVPLNPAHFDGVPAYYAHAARQNGDLSQYGEVLATAIHSINDQHGFNLPEYQKAYAAHFGPGGAYVGYIDRVTRGTLQNIASGQTDPSGIDDDQLPAIAALPALVVMGAPASTAQAAVQMTNVNDTATRHALAFADLLARVLNGEPVQTALHAAAATTTGALHTALTAALQNTQNSTDYAETTGRACHLPMALPLAFHILANTTNYTDAINANILAGGDSCGRAIIIGAVMAAAHGTSENGIPAAWITKTNHHTALNHACQTLARNA